MRSGRGRPRLGPDGRHARGGIALSQYVVGEGREEDTDTSGGTHERIELVWLWAGAHRSAEQGRRALLPRVSGGMRACTWHFSGASSSFTKVRLRACMTDLAQDIDNNSKTKRHALIVAVQRFQCLLRKITQLVFGTVVRHWGGSSDVSGWASIKNMWKMVQWI